VDDTLILDGDLSVNGLVGAGSDFYAGGGGAGGSLWIEASTFAGSGALRADGGGTSAGNAYGQGGGGAGGRVAVYASNNVFTSSGGLLSVAGGGGHEGGEAGSVYVSVTATSLVTVTASFVATPTNGAAPLTVTFTNLSASSNEIEGYQWSFGDGTTSALKNPLHVYTRTGRFTVILTAAVSDESDSKVKSDYISVTAPGPVTVTADFAATPTNGVAPLTVTFTNLSTSSNDLESYQWDFGDGGTSVLENPTHTFQAGNFTVILTATAGSESDVAIKTDYISVSAPVRLELVTRTITYTYDGLYRLTRVNYSSGEEFGYAYDSVDNMTAMTETISTTIVTTYTHNAAYQLVTARASHDGVTWHYAYDKRGNLVRQTPGSVASVEGETRYTYDAAGNLARVEFYTAGDYTTLAEAAYNGAGERARLTTWAAGVPLTVTFAVFDGQLLMSNNGIQDTLYLYPSTPLRAGGRRLIAEHQGEWAYPLPDRDGSARQIADRDGAISLARTYKPLGGLLQEQGAYESIFGYLGAQLDRVSGLLYADGRYFDPATGRFLTPQRRADVYRPRSLNPYTPWVDPTMLLLGPLMVWMMQLE
jgi:RHS repeat-associated protein